MSTVVYHQGRGTVSITSEKKTGPYQGIRVKRDGLLCCFVCVVGHFNHLQIVMGFWC